MTVEQTAKDNDRIILASRKDLLSFFGQIHLFWMAPKKQIRLELNQLSPQQQQDWAHRLNRLKNFCGCTTGAVFTLVTLVYCITAQTGLVNGFAFQGKKTILLTALYVILAGFIGKLTALCASRIILKKGIRQLLSMTEQGESNP